MTKQTDYLDFEINIDVTREGDYIVRANALGRRAEVRFADPFTEDKRTIIRQTLTTAALRSSARMRSSSATEVKTMRDLGRTLFDQVIREQVREIYYQCLGQATQQEKGLRLRLALDPTLGELPWEFLCSPQNEFLSLDPHTPIVRFIEQPNPVSPLKGELPLNLLVVIASPKDQVPLDTSAERARIATALQSLEAQNLVRVTYLEGPDTWPRLIDALRPDKTHILHFIGHGTFDESHSEGVLLMEDAHGESKMVGSELLRILIRGKRRLRLVVLNSCLGTAASQAEPLSSVGAGLVRAGVPAVIAMQFEVSDTAARIIAETFYESLALNFPVDYALTEARREIALLDRDSLEWATPVLFMQVADGQLFDFSESLSDTGPQRIPRMGKAPPARVDEGQAHARLVRAGTGEEILLDGDRFSLGRSPENDIVVGDPIASRRHALIQRQGAHFVIQDLGGPNGTWLNSQRIAEPTALQNGDVIRVGEAEFRVQLPDAVRQRPDMPFAGATPQPEATPATSGPGAARQASTGTMVPPSPTRPPPPAPGLDLNAKAAARYQAGEEAALRGDWKAAAVGYKGALILVPDYQDAKQKLAYCELQLKCSTLYQQARQQCDAGEYTKALATLVQIRSLDPGWADSADLQTLGECGQVYQQALAALRAGNRDRGAELLRQVLGIRADFKDAASRLEDLAQGGDGLFGKSAAGPTPPAGAVPAPSPAPQPVKPTGRAYELPGVDLSLLAEELHQRFLTKGFQSQVIRQEAIIMVQGQKWKGNFLRAIAGMTYAATVILEPTDTGFRASIGKGEWVEKAAIATVMAFATVGLNLVTAGLGAAEQKHLEDSLWYQIEQFVTSRGGQRPA